MLIVITMMAAYGAGATVQLTGYSPRGSSQRGASREVLGRGQRSTAPSLGTRNTDCVPRRRPSSITQHLLEAASYGKAHMQEIHAKSRKLRHTRLYAQQVRESLSSNVESPSTPSSISRGSTSAILPNPSSSSTTTAAAAFFDVDGTIVKSNVVAAFAAYQLHRLPLLQRALWLPFFLLNIPLYLVLDFIDRSLFNRVFYRSYRGISVSDKEAMADYVFSNYMQPR